MSSELSLQYPQLYNEAFVIDYEPAVSSSVLYKDIESYLCEYRFRVSFYDYQLMYHTDDGKIYAQDGERMDIKVIRGIEARLSAGQSALRERADYSGVLSLEQKLRTANPGDVILWASPPEPGDNEYGDYGFVYLGRIGSSDAFVKPINITSIRIEDNNIENYRRALSALTGIPVYAKRPQDFIAQPQVLQQFASNDIHGVLCGIFHFQVDTDEEARINQTMMLVRPYVNAFIQSIQRGDPRHQQTECFKELEWYAAEVWNQLKKQKTVKVPTHRLQSAPDFVGLYDGSKLDMVAGSCGVSGEVGLSANIFSKYFTNWLSDSMGNEKSYRFDKKGNCIVCKKKEVLVGPCSICKPCDDKLSAKISR